MRIVFVGEEAAGARALQRVAGSGHELVAVLTSGTADGRGTSVAGLAAEHGVPTTAAERVRDPALADELRTLGTDVLLNVHALHVIRREVLGAPRVGAFNLHPGPLPEYAGLNAPSWAIVHGRDRHGVTLHWMEPGIDTGDVVARADFDLSPTDTGGSVALRCAEKGLELLDDLLARLADDPATVPRLPQQLGERHYYGREVPRGGRVPWAAPTREVLDFVRAFDYRPFPSPWGSPHTVAPGVGDVAVDRLRDTGDPAGATPGEVRVDPDRVLVATGGTWVQVLAVRVAGRSRPPREVLEHGTVLGDDG